jgi:hypothetical protein
MTVSATATKEFWTREDDFAYYRIVKGADELEVYDQGTFVRGFSTWQLGLGGVVLSKRPLKVSRAGYAVMESKCPVWLRIRRVIEALIVRELVGATRLTDSQRKYLGIRLRHLAEWTRDLGLWRAVELLTDPWGRHLPLSALAHYTKFVHIPEAGELACAAHDLDGTFVVTDALLDRFGMDSLEDWLALLSEADLLPQGYSVIESRSLRHAEGIGAEAF